MSSSKRQQTMAKLNRERAVEEKRTLKRLKKQAARAQGAAETTEVEGPPEFEGPPERDAASPDAQDA
jgi:hypothetical protein